MSVFPHSHLAVFALRELTNIRPLPEDPHMHQPEDLSLARSEVATQAAFYRLFSVAMGGCCVVGAAGLALALALTP